MANIATFVDSLLTPRKQIKKRKIESIPQLLKYCQEKLSGDATEDEVEFTNEGMTQTAMLIACIVVLLVGIVLVASGGHAAAAAAAPIPAAPRAAPVPVPAPPPAAPARAPALGEKVCTEEDQSSCAIAVHWASQVGLKLGQKYGDLTSSSSLSQWRSYLAKSKKPQGCACNLNGAPAPQCHTEPSLASTPEGGWTDCQKAINFAKNGMVDKHPEWYPGLTASSPETDFQWYFAAQPNTQGCVVPCAPYRSAGSSMWPISATAQLLTPASNTKSMFLQMPLVGFLFAAAALLVFVLAAYAHVRRNAAETRTESGNYIMLI